MSQKSILSFFKQTDKSKSSESSKSENSNKTSQKIKASTSEFPSKSESYNNGHSKEEDSSKNGYSKSAKVKEIPQQIQNESPIKKTRKRKVKAIIESDEESNDSQNKIPEKVLENKTETEKMDVDCEIKSNMKDCDKEKAPENDSDSVSIPSKKRKKNKEEDASIADTSKKMEELNGSECQSDLSSEKKVANGYFSCEPSTSSYIEERTADQFVPPKRKTARKSMCKKPVEEKSFESSKTEKIETSSDKIIECETKNDETKESNAPQDSCKTLPELEKIEKISCSNMTELDSKANIKFKEEQDTMSASSKKSQAIHPFFAPKDTKEKGKKVLSTKREQNEKESTEIKDEEKSTQNNQKENLNSSKDNVSLKKKSSPSKKIKSSPSKKTKKETDENCDLKSNSDKEKNTACSSNENSDKKSINTSSTSSGVHYDPSKSKYHPINDACWKLNEKVPYLALAKTLELIENTSARLKIVEILSNFFRSVIVLTPEDLLQSVYLCLNRIAPEYEGIELGIGDMLLMKAVAQATGRTLDKIRAEVKEKGDLGLVAESSRGNQKVMFAPPKLTVTSVFSKFKEIAKMTGNAVMAKKTDKIQLLFVACRDCEAKYIIRSLSGKLRIGLAEQSVLAALARAAVMTPPGQCYPPEIIDKSSEMSSESFKKLQDAKTLILKTTYCECPNYDLVIPVLLKEGIDGLPKHCQLSPGCPLKPMLAHPTAGIDEVLKRFDNNEFTCEFKYDGERAQIHRTEKGEVKIFSRNQEDNTSKYPDVIARLVKSLKESTKSFILDTEAVAWDSKTKQILPFQVLSTRKKKDAIESEIVVQVCIMAFDLLYLNGESLVKKPLKERRQLLHSFFVEVPNEFMFVTYKDGNSAETMQEFLDESIKGNCEGLMVKALEVDASYEIAKRSHNWLKLKKDYLEGVGDTLDLVVIGGYHGKGKRTGTYGGFLLACYDNENEEFQSICKLGTGFKEDELEAHTKFLKQHVIGSPKSYYRYDHSLEPDEWFEAEQIWEVKCADLSVSPIHKAAVGIVDPEKGISLRFPRFLRIREDKKVEEATSSSQIAEMYQNQEQVQNMKTKAKTEEDYY